jgi:hypothetical protein
MPAIRPAGSLHGMARFLLIHRHEPDRCATSWAAWNGHSSWLRGLDATSSCLHGGHAVWWEVEAPNADAALALLPPYVARRSVAHAVRRVVTP